jgi:adenine-specific DNA-methyltransferase
MSYRYLGNKARIADWILGFVAERLPCGSVIADPMCGTGAMSEAFARAGYRVIAGDELRFPTLHAKARLSDGRGGFAAIDTTYEQVLANLNDLEPVEGIFFQEYSPGGGPSNGARPRGYFTPDNAKRIDAIRRGIRRLRHEGLPDLSSDLLLHDLILAANRVANIAGTYGYYRSSWSPASLAPLALGVSTVNPTSGNQHRVVQGKAADTVAAADVQALYLDPPYTKRQYGGNYHILETIAQEDEPTPIGEGGLRDWSAQASDFCYRRRAAAAFSSILDNCSARWVFISYSEDGHLTDYEMAALLAKYGVVQRYDQPLERFRSNARVARQGNVREHLYVVEMRNAGSA